MSIYNHVNMTKEQAARFTDQWSNAWIKRGVDAILKHCLEDVEIRTPHPESEIGTPGRGKAALRTWLTAHWLHTTRLAAVLARQRGIKLGVRLASSDWQDSTLRLTFCETRPGTEPGTYESCQHFQVLSCNERGLVQRAEFFLGPVVVATEQEPIPYGKSSQQVGKAVSRFFGNMLGRGVQSWYDD